MRLFWLAATALIVGCGPGPVLAAKPSPGYSPYLLIFAGDKDAKNEDFFAVIDVRPGSATVGKVVATRLTGMKESMPHHMEYVLPAKGRLLFANAHHHEITYLLDFSKPLALKIKRTIGPPAPLRFGHDFVRLSNGHMLLGFLRSEGPSPVAGDTMEPAGAGGIAEYTARGDLLRQVSAAVKSLAKPVRPYAIVPMLNIDRVVTTSAPMMEQDSADVVQIWRYSDLKLLHTIPVPPGTHPDGTAFDGAARYPFGPRLLNDGSILMNSYGCGLYRLTGIGSDTPALVNVYTFAAPPPVAGKVGGACSIPVVRDHYWIMPVGRAHEVVALDISDPTKPREVSKLVFRPDFNPHWSALDPNSNRLVIGAELGGEQGMFILTFDKRTGKLAFDTSAMSAAGVPGYIDLETQNWPHGKSGAAWGHAALFLPQ